MDGRSRYPLMRPGLMSKGMHQDERKVCEARFEQGFCLEDDPDFY